MTNEPIKATKQENIFGIFGQRDVIMWKLRSNEPLEERELRIIENALTVDCLRSEVLSQSLGGHENTFRLSTAMPRIQPKTESEAKNKELTTNNDLEPEEEELEQE